MDLINWNDLFSNMTQLDMKSIRHGLIRNNDNTMNISKLNNELSKLGISADNIISIFEHEEGCISNLY